MSIITVGVYIEGCSSIQIKYTYNLLQPYSSELGFPFWQSFSPSQMYSPRMHRYFTFLVSCVLNFRIQLIDMPTRQVFIATKYHIRLYVEFTRTFVSTKRKKSHKNHNTSTHITNTTARENSIDFSLFYFPKAPTRPSLLIEQKFLTEKIQSSGGFLMKNMCIPWYSMGLKYIHTSPKAAFISRIISLVGGIPSQAFHTWKFLESTIITSLIEYKSMRRTLVIEELFSSSIYV